jgi:hypothetical protein
MYLRFSARASNAISALDFSWPRFRVPPKSDRGLPQVRKFFKILMPDPASSGPYLAGTALAVIKHGGPKTAPTRHWTGLVMSETVASRLRIQEQIM